MINRILKIKEKYTGSETERKLIEEPSRDEEEREGETDKEKKEKTTKRGREE